MAELIALAPDVIVVGGTTASEVVLKTTHSIPIVFVVVPDPVGSGYVESLSQPRGNATGFMMFEYNLCGKWLELLKEIAPSVTHAAVLRDPAVAAGIGQFAVIQSVAPSVGIEVSPIDLREPAEIEPAIAGFAQSLKWRNDRDGERDSAGPQQFDHRSGRPLRAARGLRSTSLCRCRRIDVLWAEFC